MLMQPERESLSTYFYWVIAKEAILKPHTVKHLWVRRISNTPKP